MKSRKDCLCFVSKAKKEQSTCEMKSVKKIQLSFFKFLADITFRKLVKQQKINFLDERFFTIEMYLVGDIRG
jgi:hypothetical protein